MASAQRVSDAALDRRTGRWSNLTVVGRLALAMCCAGAMLPATAPAVEPIKPIQRIGGPGVGAYVYNDTTAETQPGSNKTDSGTPMPQDALVAYSDTVHIDSAGSWDEETTDGSWSYALDSSVTTDSELLDGALRVTGDITTATTMSAAGHAGIYSFLATNYVRVEFEVPAGSSAAWTLAGQVSKSTALAPSAMEQVCGYPFGSDNGPALQLFRADQTAEDLEYIHNTRFAYPATGATPVSASGSLAAGRYMVLARGETLGSRKRGDGAPTTCNTHVDFDFKVTPQSVCTEPGAGVMVGFARACGASLSPIEPGSPIHETTDRAWVGGFELLPRPGGKLVVNTETKTVSEEGAGVDLVIDGHALPFEPSLLPVAAAGGQFVLGDSLELYKTALKLPLAASMKVTWGPTGADAAIEMGVKVDDLTQHLGVLGQTQLNSLGGRLTATMKNGAGFVLTLAEVSSDALTIEREIPRLPFKIGDLLLRVEPQPDGSWFWTGQAALTLPVGSSVLTATGRVYLLDSRLAGGGLKVAGFNRQIPRTPLFLQSLEGDLIFLPDYAMNLGIAATVGPAPEGKKVIELAAALRTARLATDCMAGVDPVQIDGSGTFPIVEDLSLGKIEFTGRFCGYATTDLYDLRLTEQIALGPSDPSLPEGAANLVNFSGTAGGWVTENAMQSDLAGTATLAGNELGAVNGRISSVGIALCGSIGVISAGVGYRWNQTGSLQAFTGCDLSPWQASAPVASAAQANRRTVRLPRGLSVGAFSVQGRGGPPRLRLIGPRGERITTRAGLRRSRRVAWATVPQERRTFVFVKRPSRGVWRIQSLDRPIAGVRTARGLPKPKISATIRRSGTSRVLRYRIRRIPGQRVQFYDRADGIATPIGKPTNKARGRLRFKPVAGADPTRAVEAQVTQNRLPRARITVRRYRAG